MSRSKLLNAEGKMCIRDRLPSGRRLAYLKPRQQPNRFGRMSLTYEGVGTNPKWSRQETYSGRLVENATQAIARAILAEAMERSSAHGLNIVDVYKRQIIKVGTRKRLPRNWESVRERFLTLWKVL